MMGCEASGGSWGRKLGMLALGCLSPSTGCFLPAFTAGLTSSPLKHIKGFPVSRTCSPLHPISPSPQKWPSLPGPSTAISQQKAADAQVCGSEMCRA